ncbi:sensor histidine kinase [Anoxybacterium hadale]|uniref:Sensor histidine kinase n=1 Tax=Anoxybacterium hadale TaxID=3408580 RepID=A0ACD1A8Z9_9FIRM|nr:sensor histidine kinase [Clostridiales bacterium]
MNLSLERISVTYRYISCIMTSILYLTADYNESINIIKMIVVIMLWIMTVIVNGIYMDTESPKYGVAILETVGLSLLLIPTGGLDSPFIWYALNTVLLMGGYKLLYSWLMLGFYLMSGTIISMILFNSKHLELIQFIKIKSDLILVFILIVIAIRFLTKINNELCDQAARLRIQQEELLQINANLVHTNEKAERSLKHIMSLYQIMNVFSGHENNNDMINRMVEYANEVIKSKIVLSWEKPVVIDNDCMLAPIKSASQSYGYLIVKDVKNDGNFTDTHHFELLKFLADLIAVVVERNQMEKVSNELVILEEQKRIANEIHDNVSQRIFSVVCAAHAVNANLSKYNQESIREKLIMIEDSSKEIGKELKSFIYRLSPDKNNIKALFDNVNKYLHEFATLNNIKMDIDLCGDAERLGHDLKLALIRIIREATGNAVRHGECTEIRVRMSIELTRCSLIIEDNGRGFKVEELKINCNQQGLGVNNMKTLTQIFNGTFHITSTPGKGTRLRIIIPLRHIKSGTKEREGITCIS